MFVNTELILNSLPLLLEGLKVTAMVSAIGIPTGILIGGVLAYMTESRIYVARLFARSYVELVRNIPFLIIIYLAYFGLPKIGVATTALYASIGTVAFYTAGYFCEVMRAALHSVPKGQTQASKSLGMSSWTTEIHIVIPQLMSFLIPPTTSLVIMMFKDTSILSVVTLPELTYQSNVLVSTTFAYVDILGVTALLYWFSGLALELVGFKLEKYTSSWRT